MEVADLVLEEQPTNEAEHWVADVTMERRHGTTGDPTFEAVSHDEIRARAKAINERHKRREVIAVVGVAHDDVPPSCRSDAAKQSVAVAALLQWDITRAPACGGEPLAAVSTAIIGYDYLAYRYRVLNEECLTGLVKHRWLLSQPR